MTVPIRSIRSNVSIVAMIEATQIHNSDFSHPTLVVSNSTSVLPIADTDETQHERQGDLLDESIRVGEAVKRYLDDPNQQIVSKKQAKVTPDHDRQVIPRLSPILLARFSHLPRNGGTISRSDGTIIPWSTFPPSTYGGSSSSNALPTSLAEMEPANPTTTQQSSTMDVED